MKKQIIYSCLGLTLLLWACNEKKNQEVEEVPTTLEQHDSKVQSSSSWSTGSGQVSTQSSSSSGNSGGTPTSFSFSTSSGANDTTDLTSIRDLAENKDLRDFLQTEMLKLLLEDRLIESESDRVNLTITNEWVMANKKILDDDQAKKYVDLLRSKMSLGSVFNYSFNQN